MKKSQLKHIITEELKKLSVNKTKGCKGCGSGKQLTTEQMANMAPAHLVTEKPTITMGYCISNSGKMCRDRCSNVDTNCAGDGLCVCHLPVKGSGMVGSPSSTGRDVSIG